MIDIHTHILPGLDDGARDFEEALAMLDVAQADGIECIVGTPHFVPGSYAPSAAEVTRVCRELSIRAEAAGYSITVMACHEVRAAAGIMKRIREREILAYGAEGRYLLLEMQSASVPPWMDQLLFELEIGNLIPVLAHPERNTGVHRNPMRLFELVQKGCLVQATAASFLGGFGDEVRALSEKLLRHGLIHVVSSDAHDFAERRPELREAYERVAELSGAETADRLFSEHPRMILEGREFSLPEPMVMDEEPESVSFIERLFGRRRKEH